MTRWYIRAKGQIRQSRSGMNQLEAKYAEYLELRKSSGEIVWYSFGSINLRLTDKGYYKPDFAVLFKDGRFEIHECKGHWEHDARLRIKVAAEKFPFVFIAIQAIPKKEGGGWKEEIV